MAQFCGKNLIISTILGVALVAIGLVACERSFDSENRVPADKKSANFSAEYPIRLGEKKLSLRLALTDLERRQGLTGARLDSDADAGMLFVYADVAPRAFWMCGVPADLSIGFFDASGQLLEVYEMKANDTETTRSRAQNVKFALEMPPRWFEKNAVPVCAKLDLPALAAALRSRGFSPANFGLDFAEK